MIVKNKKSSTIRRDGKKFPARFEKNGKVYNRLQIGKDQAWYVEYNNDITGFVIFQKQNGDYFTKKEFPLSLYSYSKAWDLAESYFHSHG